jgi:MerR family mercuric resistance operon transcriptional regulator
MHSIGEAARQSGVTIETIRYYERKSIVPAPGRAASGRRLYTPQDIGYLRFVKRCRDLGFGMADIRVLMTLAGEQAGSCAVAGALGRAQLAQTRRKIAELQRLEAALLELTRNCDKGQTECTLLTALPNVTPGT